MSSIDAKRGPLHPTAMLSPQSTPLALIFAAERLFAEQGFGVSIRTVQEVAGSRNVSAVRYHFGNKRGLVKAVFVHRMKQVNERRVALLDGFVRSEDSIDLRRLAEVMVRPLAPELAPRAEGNYCLRFIERCVREGEEIVPAYEMLEETTGWRDMMDSLRKIAEELHGPALAGVRVELAQIQAISGLASIEAFAMRDAAAVRVNLLVEALIDAVHATLVSPASDAVLKEIAAAGNRTEGPLPRQNLFAF